MNDFKQKSGNSLRTGDQSLVRQMNLTVIMDQLRQHAPISRAGLAEITGLNKTTVSSLVRELIEANFVREVGLNSPGGRAGRLGMLLTLDPQAGSIVSCEIGVDFISTICTNFAPEVVWQQKELISPNLSERKIIDLALAILNNAIAASNQISDRLLGIAIGVPGLVEQGSGQLLFAPNLGWKNMPLYSIFQPFFQTPVLVENEASLAALGEHYFGSAQGFQEVLYISAGVGLGGGIVQNGRVFKGISGFGGEFGHMTMDPSGEICNCGNRGCWETQVSQRALFKHVITGVTKGQSSILSEMTGGDLGTLNVQMITEAARSGDSLARTAIENVGRHLGIGIASLINALNPELVILGGILSLAADFLLPVVEEEIHLRALLWNREAMQVRVARHGANACVMGGVAKVYQSILTDPGRFRSADPSRRRSFTANTVYNSDDLDRKEVRYPAS